ncbi:unnamed protein product, partial [Closterium sp. NIES-65]
MYITLYFLVTRLPDSLRVVRDHFLALCPTTLTVDSLEKALLAAEKSIVAVGASRGDPGAPIFEGCSPSPLLPSVASAAAAGPLEAGVAAAVVVRAEVAEAAAVEAEAGAEEAEAGVAVVEVVGVALRSGAALGVSHAPMFLRTGDRAGEQCGGTHTAQRCFGRLTDAWRQQFPEAAEIPRWGELSRAGVAIFDLDFDAILAAMYAVTMSDEGDYYRCFPPDPGIGIAALGASEASALGASASVLSGTVLPCPAAPSGTLSGLYLPRSLRTWALALPVSPVLRGASVLPLTPPSSSDRGSVADASHGRVGPARVRGLASRALLLLVVERYSRYTTVFPLRSKGDVTE